MKCQRAQAANRVNSIVLEDQRYPKSISSLRVNNPVQLYVRWQFSAAYTVDILLGHESAFEAFGERSS